MNQSQSTIVALRDVRFTYPADVGRTFTLHVGDLSIARGEHVACIGPSGTGKTTLIHLIAGIITPDSGLVEFDGALISALDERARRARRISSIGLVFQEFELLEYLSALDNILLPYHVGRRLALTPAVRRRAYELAEAVGISHILPRSPRRLSQGERQRVAIARALVTEPTLVIADEPTGNLDPETARVTLDLLFEQVTQCGATMITVTHNHDILDRFDRIIDMNDINMAMIDLHDHRETEASVASISATATTQNGSDSSPES